jgi:hypothetical protein
VNDTLIVDEGGPAVGEIAYRKGRKFLTIATDHDTSQRDLRMDPPDRQRMVTGTDAINLRMGRRRTVE